MTEVQAAGPANRAVSVVVFVQVIQGQVADAGKIQAALDWWIQKLPRIDRLAWYNCWGNRGGRFIELARLKSEEATRRNSNAPEQQQWSAETARLFTGRTA